MTQKDASVKKTTIQSIATTVFWYLYALLLIGAILSYSNIFKLPIHFGIASFLIGLIGLLAFFKQKEHTHDKTHSSHATNHSSILTQVHTPIFSKTQHIILFITASLILILTRLFWLFRSSVPTGYDPGWYIAGFMYPSQLWAKETFPMLFAYLGHVAIQFIQPVIFLHVALIVGSIALGYTLYFVAKKLFNSDAAIIAYSIYALSFTLYMAYWFTYVKNIYGMIFLLVAIYTWEKKHILLFLISVFGCAATHQVALLLVYVYFCFSVIQSILRKSFVQDMQFKRQWQYLLFFTCMICIPLIANFDRISEYLFTGLTGFTQTLISQTAGSGTFFSFFSYSLYTICFVPFAILGFFQLAKKYSAFIATTTITIILIVFELFFFNRLIIYAELFFILLTAYALSTIKIQKHRLHTLIGIISFFLIIVLVVLIPKQTPLISEKEFEQIKNYTPDTVLITDGYYATWMKGFCPCMITAPGLYDNQIWTREIWQQFWTNQSTRHTLMQQVNTTYVHVGERQVQFLLTDPCFTQAQKGLYTFTCPLDNSATNP